MDLLELFGNAEDAQDFAAGTVLFSEDAPGHLMYVILQGQVEVRVAGEPVAQRPPTPDPQPPRRGDALRRLQEKSR